MSDRSSVPQALSSDYQFLREWLHSLDTPRPFWQRVLMWLRGVAWRKTKWRYATLHGVSTSVYPNWSESVPPSSSEP